jgi:putative ABC transport system permease protein
VTRHAVSLGNPLPISYVDQIRHVPGVKNVIPMQWFGGIYKDRDTSNFAQFGADPNEVFDVFSEFHIPPDQFEAFKKERTACVVGEQLRERFNWQLGQKITLQGTFYPVSLELTLAGVFTSDEKDWQNLLIFNYVYLNESLSPGRGRDTVNSIRLKAASADVIPRVIEDIDGMFRNSLAQTKTETEKAFFLSFTSMWGNVKFLIFGICGVVMFSILMVVANTMAMSFRERTREVAVLKTLGFRSKMLLGLLVTEGILIALSGWLLGSGLAYALWSNLDLGRAGIGFFGHLKVLPSTMGAGLVVALLLGVLSSSIPAVRASKLQIAQALRQA